MTNFGVLGGMLIAPGLFRAAGVPGTVALCGAAILLTGATGLLRHHSVRVAPA
jgi:hypothetical protein